MFDAGLLLTLLVNCAQCDDVRLGDNIAIGSSPTWISLVNVVRVTLYTPISGDERYVVLYSSGTNHSTDKYILAADFSTVTVRSVTVRDEGEYVCQVSRNLFGNTRTATADTTIAVYGKQKLRQFVEQSNDNFINHCSGSCVYLNFWSCS